VLVEGVQGVDTGQFEGALVFAEEGGEQGQRLGEDEM